MLAQFDELVWLLIHAPTHPASDSPWFVPQMLAQFDVLEFCRLHGS